MAQPGGFSHIRQRAARNAFPPRRHEKFATGFTVANAVGAPGVDVRSKPSREPLKPITAKQPYPVGRLFMADYEARTDWLGFERPTADERAVAALLD